MPVLLSVIREARIVAEQQAALNVPRPLLDMANSVT